MGARRRRALPKRSVEEVVAAYPKIRQSLLGEFDNCALMTKFGLEGYQFDNHAQARGHIFHLFAEEVLRTLKRTGEFQIPIEEALVILYEVCAQRHVPDAEVVILPAAERRLLRMAAIKFVNGQTFGMDKLIEVEDRLDTTIVYPHPETGEIVERVLTGKPDALLADPPDGYVVLDWKTTLQPPPRYSGDQTDTPQGVSYMGYFQQRFYALLVFKNYPAAARVTLREFYPLAGEARSATVTVSQVEHLEREFAAQAELLDRAIAGGSRSRLWRPSPGKHCTFCPKPTSCPIEADVRVFAAGSTDEGGVAHERHARKLAAEYVLSDRVRGSLHNVLKSWVEVHGPIPVKSAKGRFEVRWGLTKNGSRRFGVWAAAETDRRLPEDRDLTAAFDEAAARRKAA